MGSLTGFSRALAADGKIGEGALFKRRGLTASPNKIRWLDAMSAARSVTNDVSLRLAATFIPPSTLRRMTYG